MTKRNIVISLNSGEQMGGVERHVGDLIKGLSHEFNFTVCCKYGPMVEEYRKYGGQFVELYPHFDFDLVFLLKFFRLLRLLNPVVVHAHELKAGFNATLAAYFAHVQVRIYHVHTPITQWQLPQWKKKTLFKLNIFANKVAGNIFATHVIALTAEIKKERIDCEGIKSTRIVVIPNGVDIKKFRIQSSEFRVIRNETRKKWNIKNNEFVIGNISRLTEEKGHEILLKAFTKLPKGKFPFLVIAGGGHLKSSLKALSATLGINDRVKFLGKFTDEDKVKILLGFDIFAFPTLAEGFGIVMMEAMAAKIPIIASDLPVLKEVAGGTVEYFKVGDFSDLGRSLESFEPNSDRVDKAFERVKNRYSMERFLNSYRNLYGI